MRKMLIGMMLLLMGGSISAQTPEAVEEQTVRRDTVPDVEIAEQPTDDHYRVVTNRFRDNWFVLGSVGYHGFFGDYGSVGDFKGKLSPDFNVGNR